MSAAEPTSRRMQCYVILPSEMGWLRMLSVMAAIFGAVGGAAAWHDWLLVAAAGIGAAWCALCIHWTLSRVVAESKTVAELYPGEEHEEPHAVVRADIVN